MDEQSIYTDAAIQPLLKGQTPDAPELLIELSVGIDFLTDFLDEQYLADYIPAGGSKIKFLTGRSGSGKTHVAKLLSTKAARQSYLTVFFSARDIWLHDFREIYLEILRQCDIEHVLEGCANEIIRQMGYDPSLIEPGLTFMDYLAEIGEGDPLSRNTIRQILREFFYKNPRLDNNFALACSLLTGGILGHPVLEENTKQLLLAYLSGDKSIKLSQLRPLGLSPSRITRYNARNMLRSLSETAHMGGFKGILVVIDDMESLLNRSKSDVIHYTKLRREDAYESIRQLIDDIDNMRYLMFIMSFDRELMDSEATGIKAYQALWMRIQSEVVGAKFNRFADILDLDRLSDQIYTPEVLCQMADRLVQVLTALGHQAFPLDLTKAAGLIEKADYGGLGLPFLVNRAVLEGGGSDDQ